MYTQVIFFYLHRAPRQKCQLYSNIILHSFLKLLLNNTILFKKLLTSRPPQFINTIILSTPTNIHPYYDTTHRYRISTQSAQHNTIDNPFLIRNYTQFRLSLVHNILIVDRKHASVILFTLLKNLFGFKEFGLNEI